MIETISEGEKKRECVEIIKFPSGKKISITFHQTKIKGKWDDNINIVAGKEIKWPRHISISKTDL